NQQNRHQDRNGAHNSVNFVNEFKTEWISKQIDTPCIAFAEKFGKELKERNFTTSQIRNVFGEIRRIQMNGFEKNKTSFLLLKPKIAYATARQESMNSKAKDGAKVFREVFMKAHEAVNADENNSEIRFKNFCDFIEAVLAFHKAAGGKD
ncbi:MAG: type III-A CRISPR-associated protein Csm2, partial [Hymenobacteraceae bacterium]|nr:type III-A CRISPR-associated protein Csm2 [Hymenobacteraceae bacterium]MDX5396584.1 type III-A CRISPR-associated protein Csm2 [Hymenobacteraceae bacterium]MDX5512647.1 type III-A CRISPR-associated protein Csm2 [Hymenobacteraceae bacterium]